MREVLLNDGHKLPLTGFGTYKATHKTGTQAVVDALAKGYRLIDTASKYKNETAVGDGIMQSDVPREEIFITTKLWRENLGYEQAKVAFYESLKNLQVDYIDLYLIHWPANAKNYKNWQQANADTWRALEELQAEGKIKSIGVSNFWEEHLQALLKTAKVIPAVNQIEFHPGYWQKEVTDFCKNKGIVIQAWSPLARGKVFDTIVLQEIAEKHQKTVAQICLRWIFQHQIISIPKSVSTHRMDENLNLFDFELSTNEMDLINNLPKMGFSGELPNHWPDKQNVL